MTQVDEKLESRHRKYADIVTEEMIKFGVTEMRS